MHIYFSGIGGAGIGPLAQVAAQAGFEVSGSDKQDSSYIQYLKQHGLKDIHIGQSRAAIAKVHAKHPIDWFVYSSAVSMEQPGGAEQIFCRSQKIKMSKRDELINLILKQKKLKLIAVAGTHGKTTTTAMLVWLFTQLKLPVSYSVPAKTSFAEMGHYDPQSEYFVYEADEFDRNFLEFEPYLSLITGVSWDHHEIFPTREEYQQAFREFIGQSQRTILWQEDYDYLGLSDAPFNLLVQGSDDPLIDIITLKGRYNRLDAWLAIQAMHRLSKTPLDKLIQHINRFPGLQRRMEQIVPGLYSDYAHTPEKIRGAMSVALELCERTDLSHNQSPRPVRERTSHNIHGERKLVVVYEPLHNRRQHHMIDDYGDCFAGVAHLYWLPSYLAREDPAQRLLEPAELISHLADPSIAEPAKRGAKLKQTIQNHLTAGDMVVCMAGGGGGSLDEWTRKEFQP